MAQKNPNILNILKLRHGIKVLEQINAMACKTRHYGSINPDRDRDIHNIFTMCRNIEYELELE